MRDVFMYTKRTMNKNDNQKKTELIDKAFILGNGSDRPTDKEWLNNLEGDTYGCNALYRDWEPDFLVANDWSMMVEIINSTYTGHCYFTDFEELPMEALNGIQYMPEYDTAIHIGEQEEASTFVFSGGTVVVTDESNSTIEVERSLVNAPEGILNVEDQYWYIVWLDESLRHITWGFKPQFEYMSTGLCALQLALETGYDEIDVIGFSGLKNNNYKNVYEGTKNYTFDPVTPNKDRVPETYVPLNAGHQDGVYRNLVKQYPKTKVNLI